MHKIPAIQTYSSHPCCGMDFSYRFAICYHTCKCLGVNDNLAIRVRMTWCKNSPCKHIDPITRSCEHSGVLIVGGSNVCLHRRTQKCGVDLDCVQSYSCKHKEPQHRRPLKQKEKLVFRHLGSFFKVW